MTKGQAQTVASEMKSVGFVANARGNTVEISLTSRKVNQMEVRHALDQIFGGIEFNLRNSYDGVTVV